MLVLFLQSSLVRPIADPCLVLALDPAGVLLARAGQVLLERRFVGGPILFELCLCFLQVLLDGFRFDSTQHASLHEVGFFVARQFGYQPLEATAIQLVLFLAQKF